MTVIQALGLAILQGVTELFPVSSLGHAVIAPRLFGWQIDQLSPAFLPFVVALHIGTAFAALIFFWRDWWQMLRGDRRLLMNIVVATLPAVVLALLFEKMIRQLFATPLVAAGFLVVNGGLLFVGERRRRRGGHLGLEQLTWRDALVIGLSQALALIPGISRSGATMVTGLMRGLRHEEAARFSFLIATPIILGAGIHELPKLRHMTAGDGRMAELALIGGTAAGVTAFLSILVLMVYFHRQDVKALDPFAWYCWAAGLLSLAMLLS